MSTKAVGWALDQQPRNATAKLVLIALADFAGENGESWYGRKKLAKVCLVALSTLDSALASLVADGLIAIEPRYRDDGSLSSNLYRVLVDPTPADDSGTPIIGRRVSTVGHHDPISDPISDPTVLKNSATTKGLDVEKLASEFAATFNEAELQEHIADSLAHVNARKWNDKTRYCRNWLKRAAEDKQRRGGTNGTQRTNTSLSQFTRGAGSDQSPAGTDSEWWRRVGRYQQGD